MAHKCILCQVEQSEKIPPICFDCWKELDLQYHHARSETPAGQHIVLYDDRLDKSYLILPGTDPQLEESE